MKNVDDMIDEMSTNVSMNDCYFILTNINWVIIYKCYVIVNIYVWHRIVAIWCYSLKTTKEQLCQHDKWINKSMWQL